MLNRRQQADGTFVLSLTADPDAPTPMIDTRKDTGHFVRALIQLPPGKNLLAYGSMISWKDYMTLWAKTLKLPGGHYKQLTIAEMEQIAPGGLGREVGEGWMAQGEFGYDGGDPTVIHPGDVSIVSSQTVISRSGADSNYCSLVSISQRRVLKTTSRLKTGPLSSDEIYSLHLHSLNNEESSWTCRTANLAVGSMYVVRYMTPPPNSKRILALTSIGSIPIEFVDFLFLHFSFSPLCTKVFLPANMTKDLLLSGIWMVLLRPLAYSPSGRSESRQF